VEGLRPIRLLGLAVALSGACWLLLSVSGSTPQARAAREKASASTAAAWFTYHGEMKGEKDGYGFISVSKPYAKTGHLAWGLEWDVKCKTKAYPLVVGVQFSCLGPVTIDGWEKQTFTDPVLGQDCTGTIHEQKNARWTLNATVHGRTTVMLSASPPLAEIATRPSPPDSNCLGPDEAIHWTTTPDDASPPNIVKNVHEFATNYFTGSQESRGEYIDNSHGRSVIRGHVTSDSTVDMFLVPEVSVPYFAAQRIVGVLGNLAHRIANSLDNLGNQMEANTIPAIKPPFESTYVGTTGTLSGQGTSSGSPRYLSASAGTGPLFTIHQHIGSGFTLVTIHLTPAGRRFLAAGAQRRSRSH